MTSMAAKRRAKRARRISLAGGQTAEAKPMGRDRWHTQAPDGPPPILAARAARCAVDPSDPLHADDMGRCILALAGPDKARITDTWFGLRAAHRNYRARIIGRTGDPQGAASPMLHDPVGVDPSYRVDLRTAEERDIAARNSWAAWNARLTSLPSPQHKWVLRGALDGFVGDDRLWHDCSPTALGRLAVDALRRLVEQAKD